MLFAILLLRRRHDITPAATPLSPIDAYSAIAADLFSLLADEATLRLR